ncbi:MAG: hypothetical protein CK424_08230 [Legionella sp.]|nr:MAG: hypothetical protein CK424_08230 [Legionella sp.]
MIINLSKDFEDLAYALAERYDEPVIEFPGNQNWTHDLSVNTHEKPIKRLTIIGHGDSLYDDNQSMFGGNINERVMQIEDFTHALLMLLKYNERLSPGFCKYLQTIDIIDCHKSELTCKNIEIAEYLYEDAFLKEAGAHIHINGFTNPTHPKFGTTLAPHAKKPQHLLFYAFDSKKAFEDYKKLITAYDDSKIDLHRMEQMPNHPKLGATPEKREQTIESLKTKCENLLEKKKHLLRTKTHKVRHIIDPRDYFKKHPECQILLSKASQHKKHPPHPFEQEPSKHSKKSPRFFSKDHTKATKKDSKKKTTHPHR